MYTKRNILSSCAAKIENSTFIVMLEKKSTVRPEAYPDFFMILFLGNLLIIFIKNIFVFWEKNII